MRKVGRSSGRSSNSSSGGRSSSKRLSSDIVYRWVPFPYHPTHSREVSAALTSFSNDHCAKALRRNMLSGLARNAEAKAFDEASLVGMTISDARANAQCAATNTSNLPVFRAA